MIEAAAKSADTKETSRPRATRVMVAHWRLAPSNMARSRVAYTQAILTLPPCCAVQKRGAGESLAIFLELTLFLEAWHWRVACAGESLHML